MVQAVRTLNYHHLEYFWAVARTGSVAAAARELHVSQPTISAQLRTLATALGTPLFRRVGRRLVLTDEGRTVFRYADEMFTLGRELLDALAGRAAGRPLVFHVGVADVLPKLVAFRLLEPALQLSEPVRLVCEEGPPRALLARLAAHELDLVLSDAPVGADSNVRAYSHLLGECGLTVCGAAPLAQRLRRGFPGSLDGAPLLLPTSAAPLRRALDRWLAERGLRPRIVGEFEDTALLKVFGEAGAGLFAVPSVVADDVVRRYGVRRVGRIAEVRARFYALSVERRVKHPAVVVIARTARQELFD